MILDIYQVDAFTDKLFSGNPAAVIPLKTWLPDEVMQLLALENNLSETVFFVPAAEGGDYDFDIRWFTPDVEVNLCGHATLASAYILFNRLGFAKPFIRFNSKSGILSISREEGKDLNQDAKQPSGKITMDFPSWKPKPRADVPELLLPALGVKDIVGLFQYRDLLVLLENEEDVRDCDPDFNMLKKLSDKVIITAPGKDCDFVSRFFAAEAGINEDPVTGSSHSQLIPFWSERLGKSEMHAKQLSRRGGEIWCSDQGNRVTMTGSCVFYMKGEFELEH